MDDDFDDVVAEFLVESLENLDSLDREIVDLEADPTSPELLGSIFRSIHTVKGTSSFFGFSHLESVSHAGESLLSVLREGALLFTPAHAAVLLEMCDAIRVMLTKIEATGADGDESYPAIVDRLRAMVDGADDETSVDASEAAAETEDVVSEDMANDPRPVVEMVALAGAVAAVESPGEAAPDGPAGEAVDGDEHGGPNGTSAHAADTSIRVDVKRLDMLMNLVGELVLARNQVLQFQTTQGDPNFQATSQQLNLITTELQEEVMKTRMQPIGNIWSKFPRIVHDLSASLGKHVRLRTEGEDTELDKTLIEAIKDPLTHIVRNSVDHGIETPEERVEAGKDETGTLTLRAFHEGGQVIIQISDDGAGLKLDRIKEKAVANGILTGDRAAELSDRDAANLVFRAGLSTAEAVTNVSGRGVGMDVVKTNIEKIGGTIDLASQPGRGTTLTVRIPLTLAIIPALIISTDADRYLIPQVNLVEVLHLENASQSLERAGDADVFRLRGTLLPIVHLRDILDLETRNENGTGTSIVVLQAEGRQFGLVVDDINDTEEIVVKPLGPHLKTIRGFAGTTILGDGTVALILDAVGLARLGGVLAESEHATAAEEQIDSTSDDRRGNVTTLLVCLVGDERIAIPLGLVARLEEFDTKLVEHAGGQDVIQYRGGLLHIYDLHQLLMPGRNAREFDDDEPLRVVVYESHNRTYGLIVDEVIDVFDADLAEGEPTTHEGLSLTGVIGRRVTDVLDIETVIESYDREPALSASR